MKKILSVAALLAAIVFCSNCTKLEPNKITNEGCKGKVSAQITFGQKQGGGVALPVPNILVKLQVTDVATSTSYTLFEMTDNSGMVKKDFPCSGYDGISIAASGSFSAGTDKYSGSKTGTAKLNQIIAFTVEMSKEPEV